MLDCLILSIHKDFIFTSTFIILLSLIASLQGRAQVMYPYASSFEQTAEKLEYDMYYLPGGSGANSGDLRRVWHSGDG